MTPDDPDPYPDRGAWLYHPAAWLLAVLLAVAAWVYVQGVIEGYKFDVF